MLRHLVRKEILEYLISFKFVLAFALCSALILLAVYTGSKTYQEQMEEYVAAKALNDEDLQKLLALNQPWQVWEQGYRVARPPTALSALAYGVEGDAGRIATLSRETWVNFTDSKFENDALFAFFGVLDLTFIVRVVLSLVVILFTFNAICGEKEAGTLRLTASFPVPKDLLILGKAIGGFISLLIPFLFPLLIGLAYLSLSPHLHFSAEDWTRLAFIVAVFLLYLALFFVLGLCISALTHRTSSAFLILLVIWIFFVVVIPKVSSLVAGSLERVPTVYEVQAQQDQIWDDARKPYRKELDAFFEGGGWGEPFTEQRQKAIAYLDGIDQKIEAVARPQTDALEQRYFNRYNARIDLAMNLSRISPASAINFAAMRLAWTGIERHRQLRADLRQYREVLQTFAEEENKKRRPAYGISSSDPYWKTNHSMDGFPRFVFGKGESLRASASAISVDVILLGSLTVLLFAGAYVAFLKYDVR